MSVMGIGRGRRRIGDPFGRHQTSASGPAARTGNKSGNLCVDGCFRFKNAVLRHLAVPGLALLIGIGGALAQSGDPRAQDQPRQAAPPIAADAAKDNQRKTDEFVEASQAINGPAGNPECVWLGRRVVRLMWRDDLDTAFRHLDLYDRFGCPGGHVQATFRCLTRFGGQIDPKVAGNASTAAFTPAGSIRRAQPQAAAAATTGACDRRQRRASAGRCACAPPPAPAAAPAK